VTRAYREGDRLASQLVQQTILYLAAGVVSLINAFNPCLFILGGGLSEGVPDLIQSVEAQVRKNALEAALQKLRFSKAALGEYAGVIGASAFAREVAPSRDL
jgi:glucokinase